MDDFECQMDNKCWYPTARHATNKTKQCMKAYFLQDGSKIGFREEYHPNMKYQNYISNGRVCKSMFAVPSLNDPRQGVCASYSKNQGSSCPVFTENNNVNGCKYSFNQESAFILLNCDCTLMGSNYGRCPLASIKTF
jgi:hypothetical protein